MLDTSLWYYFFNGTHLRKIIHWLIFFLWCLRFFSPFEIRCIVYLLCCRRWRTTIRSSPCRETIRYIILFGFGLASLSSWFCRGIKTPFEFFTTLYSIPTATTVSFYPFFYRSIGWCCCVLTLPHFSRVCMECTIMIGCIILQFHCATEYGSILYSIQLDLPSISILDKVLVTIMRVCMRQQYCRSLITVFHQLHLQNIGWNRNRRLLRQLE